MILLIDGLIKGISGLIDEEMRADFADNLGGFVRVRVFDSVM